MTQRSNALRYFTRLKIGPAPRCLQIRIPHAANALRQRQHLRPPDRGFGEVGEANRPVVRHAGQGIRQAELGVHAAFGPHLPREGLADLGEGRTADAGLNPDEILRAKPVLLDEIPEGGRRGVGEAAGGKRLQACALDLER